MPKEKTKGASSGLAAGGAGVRSFEHRVEIEPGMTKEQISALIANAEKEAAKHGLSLSQVLQETPDSSLEVFTLPFDPKLSQSVQAVLLQVDQVTQGIKSRVIDNNTIQKLIESIKALLRESVAKHNVLHDLNTSLMTKFKMLQAELETAKAGSKISESSSVGSPGSLRLRECMLKEEVNLIREATEEFLNQILESLGTAESISFKTTELAEAFTKIKQSIMGLTNSHITLLQWNDSLAEKLNSANEQLADRLKVVEKKAPPKKDPSEIDALKKHIAELEAKLSDAHRARDQAREGRANAEAENKRLKAQLREIQSDHQKTLAALRSEISALQSKAAGLAQEYKRMPLIIKAEQEKQMTSMKAAITPLMATLRQQLGQVTARAESAESKVAELTAELARRDAVKAKFNPSAQAYTPPSSMPVAPQGLIPMVFVPGAGYLPPHAAMALAMAQGMIPAYPGQVAPEMPGFMQGPPANP
ncbi:MAG: hypothetical protein K0R66_858 [Gammaproteobacteria bacterium]|jgi:hypothetical protein|nr:hypothetical protein [Gammaproteobacteria bacterium]